MEQSPERNPSEQNEHPPRNLRTHYDETFEAVASIEAKPKSLWHQEQAKERADQQPMSFPNAMRWLREVSPTKKRGHFTIYGDGGVNRWIVWPDGQVTYFLDEESKAGTKKDAQRAAALGFEVVTRTRPS